MKPTVQTSISFQDWEGNPVMMTGKDAREGLSPARMSRTRTLVAILVAILILTGIAAANPTSSPSPDSEEVRLQAIASTYLDCMNAANMPVMRQQDPKGYWTIVYFSMSGITLWRDLQGQSGMIVAYSSDDYPEQVREFMYIPDPRPVLIINQQDYTDVYVNCLQESGYDQTAASALWTGTDPEAQHWDDLRRQAGEQWISCARRNGWPTIPDLRTDSASAVIPSTMTQDQLRRLLNVCSNFNEVATRAQLDWSFSHPGVPYPEEVSPDPDITVELAGLDATYPPWWMSATEKRVVATRIAGLYDVLNEKIRDFFQRYNDEQSNSIAIFGG